VRVPSGANAAPPYFEFQVQKTKAQQQQLTIPITFVAASALPNFFLRQNLTNMSTSPDLPDPKTADSKGDGKASLADGANACAYPSCDKIRLGRDKAARQIALIKKANAIRTVIEAQIDAAKDKSGAYGPPEDYCPKDQGVNFVLPSLSVVLPQAFKTEAQ
jgi:hypothetical protein